MIRVYIEGNVVHTLAEEEYGVNYQELCRRYQETNERLSELETKRQQRENRALAIGGMLFKLHKYDGFSINFNKKLWNATIDSITVYADGRLVFHFKEGKKVQLGINSSVSIRTQHSAQWSRLAGSSKQ